MSWFADFTCDAHLTAPALAVGAFLYPLAWALTWDGKTGVLLE